MPASNPEIQVRTRGGAIETAATGPSERAARTNAPAPLVASPEIDPLAEISFASQDVHDLAKGAGLTAADFTGQTPDAGAAFSRAFVEAAIAAKPKA